MEEAVTSNISSISTLTSLSSGGADGTKHRSLFSFISVGNPRVGRNDDLPGCQVVNENENFHGESAGVLTKVIPVVVRG